MIVLEPVKAGTTSLIVEFDVFDASSTTGARLAGLLYNTASLTAYYDRVGAAGAATQISLVTMTKGTFSSGGFVAVDGTNMPGVYQLSVPNAAIAAGASAVTIELKGAANMVPVVIRIPLVVSTADDVYQLVKSGGAGDATLILKLLRNKTVESADGTTVTVYDDNGTTVLGTFAWNEATKTRGRLT